MFQPLLTRLADDYHLVAPDYPGFGHSTWPDPKQFDYTFDRIASVMTDFTQALGLSNYTLYMQDYGGPVGFRMALAHPERVQALIIQDAVAHNEGLGANWVNAAGILDKSDCKRRSAADEPVVASNYKKPATLAMIQTLSFMTPIFGPTSMRF